MVAAGPTRIGVISPCAAASMAPASDVSSHGYATAVGPGCEVLTALEQLSYLPVPVWTHSRHGSRTCGSWPARSRSSLLEKEREHDGESDAVQERLEGRPGSAARSRSAEPLADG